jgi:hypothetical protein
MMAMATWLRARLESAELGRDIQAVGRIGTHPCTINNFQPRFCGAFSLCSTERLTGLALNQSRLPLLAQLATFLVLVPEVPRAVEQSPVDGWRSAAGLTFVGKLCDRNLPGTGVATSELFPCPIWRRLVLLPAPGIFYTYSTRQELATDVEKPLPFLGMHQLPGNL